MSGTPPPPPKLDPKRIQLNISEKNWLQPAPARDAIFPSPLPQKLRSSGPTLPTPEELTSFIEHCYDLDPRTRLTVNAQTSASRDTAKNILFFEESESLREIVESLKPTLKSYKKSKLDELNTKMAQAEINSKKMGMRSPMIDIYITKIAIWKTFKPTIYQFSVTARFFLWICRENKDNSTYPPTPAQFSVINERWKDSDHYPKQFRYGSSLNPISIEDSKEYFDIYVKYDHIRFQSLSNNKEPMDERLNEVDKNLIHPSSDPFLQFIFYNINFQAGVDFSSRDLQNLFLQATSIPRANLSNSNFSNTKLLNSKLPYSHAENAIFNDCDFREANLRGCKFQNCQFKRVDFRGATLNEAEFIHCDLSGANFSGGLTELTVYNSVTQQLTESIIFINCILNSCDFSLANIQGIELQKNNQLEGVNFQGTNLSYSDLSSLYLKDLIVGQIVAEYTSSGNISTFNTYKTSFAFTNCYSCRFEGVDLSQIETSKTNLSECSFVNCKIDLMKMRACLLHNSMIKSSTKIIRLSAQLISDFVDKGVNFEKYPSDCLDSLIFDENDNDLSGEEGRVP